MFGILSAVVALYPAASQTPPVPEDLDPSAKVYGLSLFWKEASDHFVFVDKLREARWDEKYQEYIPKVLATKSLADYYQVLQEFGGLLKDSHTGVGPPQGLQVKSKIAGPGVSVAADEGVRRLFVLNVFKSLADRIPVGSEVVKVEGQPVNEYVEKKWGLEHANLPTERRWTALYSLALAGPPEEDAHFTIVTPEGETRDVSAPRRRLAGDSWSWDAWPRRDAVEYRDLGGGIAYVALNSFREMTTAEEFEKLIPTLKKAKGLILDLRNNGGGNDLVGVRICRHLTTGAFSSFLSRTRVVKSAYKAWGVYVDPSAPNLSQPARDQLDHYRGTAFFEIEPDRFQGLKTAELLMPKVVLTGGSTASAAEDTLIYMSFIPNLTTVGQRTAGSTGQPLVFNLPGGGTGFVCTQHCRLPDGREFMGIGIPPEVELPRPTVKDRIARRDTTLEKGIEVLKSKLPLTPSLQPRHNNTPRGRLAQW